MVAVSLKKKVSVLKSAIAGYDAQGIRAFRLSSGSVYAQYTKEEGNYITFITDASVVGGASDTIKYHLQPADNSRGDFEAGASYAVPNAESASEIVIPQINVQMRSEAIVAKTKKLKAQWTPEFAQDLNAYHSLDAEAELTAVMSEYISLEIDLEILDMLISSAAAGTEFWSAVNNNTINAAGTGFDTNLGFYNTQGQWFQTLGTKMQKLSNIIHQRTLRGGANFIVVSPNVATILESMNGFSANPGKDATTFSAGVTNIGSISNRYDVYKNPYMTENVLLMGFKGSNFFETGAVYAPYVPLIMTPLVYDPTNFTPRRGVMTRYAKKIVRPEFYGKVVIGGLETL